MAFDPFNSLAPSTRPSKVYDRLRPAATGRARLRIGVGAAVVLLLAALGVTVTVTAIGQVGQSVEVPALPDDPTAGASADPFGESVGDTKTPGVFVHVLGSVLNPGLFEVHEGARVVDVVAAAGGLLPTADESGLNLARPVSDGEQLYVPAVGEVVAGGPAGTQGSGAAPGGSPPGVSGSGAGVPKVNLNSATAADLDTLPRIGPAMAQRILDYRAAEGRFASVDDLRNVTGIGDKTFAALKDLITV